jgi:hypothetical protein
MDRRDIPGWRKGRCTVVAETAVFRIDGLALEAFHGRRILEDSENSIPANLQRVNQLRLIPE